MIRYAEDRPFRERYEGRKVLITGGLGFLGSNLTIRLVDLGADVTLVDSMIDNHGANLFNIDPVRNSVRVNVSDVRDMSSLKIMIRGQDFIFHLAGQNDHIQSREDPFPDIDINIRGTVTLLESCRRFNPEARLIYSGTRGEYGSAAKLPVSEDKPLNPKGIYELSSMAAQQFFRIYHDNDGLRAITMRLTNIYGERAQMKHNRFGVVNWFVRLALEDETIPVFGDGTIKRDFLYVQDAVGAMIAAAATDSAYGHVLNVGHDESSDFRSLAENIVRLAGKGRWCFTPFSPERRAQEPGDFISDITRIGNLVGWRPKTSLEEGLRQTIEFYRKHRSRYW